MKRGLDLAVIIVSWNVRSFLTDCLASLHAELACSGLAGAVWVVDNGSTDGSLALLRRHFPQVHLIANEENAGFGAANNQGMAAAAVDSPRYFLLLNPDTVIKPGALTALVACLDERPAAGMAGAHLLYGDGRLQHSAFKFPGLVQLAYDLFPLPARWYESGWNGRYPARLYRSGRPPFAVDCILGAAMLVRRDVAQATGGFDTAFHLYSEEIDWCWRIRAAGWEIYSVPSAEIVHYAGESTRQVQARAIVNLWQSRAQLYARHHHPGRQAVAAWLVRLGLACKAKGAAEPALQEAYRRAAAAWSGKRDGRDRQ